MPALAAGIALLALLAAAFPVGLLRGAAERRLSAMFEAPVTLGALSRRDRLSFTPEIVVHDLRIGQPAWAGKGDFLRLSRATADIPIFPLLTGRVAPRSLRIEGMELALVRDAKGNGNWTGRGAGGRGRGEGLPFRLDQLTIENGRFSLRDAKRRLDLEGTLAAGPRTGLAIAAAGQFDGARAEVTAQGGRAPPGGARRAGWPFDARLRSDILDLSVRGTMAGALDLRDMRMGMRARADSLKRLDRVIEAGLFGTQQIDLSADVRHKGEDWFIDTLAGTIGRSRLEAAASVLKRNGRTRIDARLRAPQLDFDDLADDAGLAEARAKEARIGKRVIPDTRIDLSRMGPTDGRIRFSIDRLLVKGGSVFRSLRGDLTLDHRVLKLENAVAALETGRLKGWVKVDSTRPAPILSTELRVEGATLETLIGQPDEIRGPVRGLVRITGRGGTIREAFINGKGRIAFVADRGAMNRAAAFMLGQDLGGALSQKLRDADAMAPIRCAILAFEARDGVLRPAPLIIDAGISRGSGQGRIDLDGETLRLAINGGAREKAVLALVDPVRVEGTLSNPTIRLNRAPASGKDAGTGMIRTLGRSIGAALGLRGNRRDADAAPVPAAMDCSRLAGMALR